MVRGAARGITVPTNLGTVWSNLQHLLQEMVGSNGVSVETSFFQSLFNGLVKEEQILGSLRAGVQWTPSVRFLTSFICLDRYTSNHFNSWI